MPTKDEAMRRLADDILGNLQSELNKMYDDVLSAARKICPDLKTETKRINPSNIEVLLPTDKKSAECFIKAIDKLLSQAKGLHPTLLSQYKTDLKTNFQI